jgi:multisubunit Na+/H+ antiporter MnhE subunit
VSSSSRGVSVQSTILSFNSTRSRLFRSNLAPLKLAKILSFVIALLKAILKASKKVVFLT